MTVEIAGGPRYEYDRHNTDMVTGHLYLKGAHPEVSRIITSKGPKEIGIPVIFQSPLSGQVETDWQVYGPKQQVEQIYTGFISDNPPRFG